ncbi:MAG: amidohydrolase [Stenotrophobium sp.]
MLIRDAELDFGARRADVRIADGCIVEIAPHLIAGPDEAVINAAGAALLPGLHDHHLHLCALAASMASVQCGPPQVHTAEELGGRLSTAADRTEAGAWIRGIGYHESVAGEIDGAWLDRLVADRPVRIQHRSGRLWILNSHALEKLNIGQGSDPLERKDGKPTGRLYDADDWLRKRLGGERPSLRQVSRLLAGYGVTGVTDTTPNNGPDAYRYFSAAQQRGELLQDIVVMGDARLDHAMDGAGIRRGAHKFHLHDAELPEFDALCAQIRGSHDAGRNVAFHCVTRTDLVFALGALQQAGSRAGDRIEHASVTPPDLMALIAELGLTVVTQPNFIAERGDAYLDEVAADDRPWLYRLRGFLDAGIPLAGSTDAPFGVPDPWAAMQAAVSRRSHSGRQIGEAEALTPEEAFTLFASTLETPDKPARRVEAGVSADLCLLSTPWQQARADLATVRVRMTLKEGRTIWAAEK